MLQKVKYFAFAITRVCYAMKVERVLHWSDRLIVLALFTGRP